MNLYQLNQEVENFEFNIDDETGEITNIDELDNLSLALDEKRENVALFIKNLKADVTALDAEQKALYARKKQTKKKVQALSNYLARNLAGEKFETPKCKVSYRKSTQVKYLGEESDFINYALENHKELLKQETKYKPIKAEIKKAIQNGVPIEFAYLSEEVNMQIK